MANKKLLFCFILVFLFCSDFVLSAETVEENNIGEVPVEQEWQILEWSCDNSDFVMNYEVVVEQLVEDGSYIEIRRMVTEDASTSIKITPQLPVGVYRYQVITYNLIGFPDEPSDWCDFTIFQAHEPEVNNVRVNANLTSVVYLDEYNDGIFTVRGKDMYNEPESAGSTEYSIYSFTKKNSGKNDTPVVPKIFDIASDHKSLKFSVDVNNLDIGTYNFMVTDASGLTSELKKDNEIAVRFKKAVDFNLSAGYTVPVEIFDGTLENFMGNKYFLKSAAVNADFIFLKKRFGYFGIGVDGYYTLMNMQTDNFSIEGQLINCFGNVIYQMPVRKTNPKTNQIKHIASFELHAGAGATYFHNYVFHFEHNLDSEPLESVNFSVKAGIGGMLFVFKRLYARMDVDFVYSFISDMQLGLVLPSVKVGWQF